VEGGTLLPLLVPERHHQAPRGAECLVLIFRFFSANLIPTRAGSRRFISCWTRRNGPKPVSLVCSGLTR